MKRISVIGLIAVTAIAVASAQEGVNQTDSATVIPLGEVTVKASPEMISNRGEITTITVQGTAFSRIGSVGRMLPNLPGLTKTPDGISVPGYGKPPIYIDGREITNEKELEAISSDNIRSISIDRAPGPQYPAGTVAVVSITTVKSARDYLYLNAENSAAIFRRFRDDPMLAFRAQAGRFATSLTYTFSFLQNLNKETYFREIYHDDGEKFSLTQQRENPLTSRTHALNWSGEWRISDHSHAGLHYYFSGDNSTENLSGYNITTDGRSEPEHQWSDERTASRTRLHSLSAVYDYRKDYTSLHISQDYASNSPKRDINAGEQPVPSMPDGSDIHTAAGGSSDVLTTRINGSLLLPWNIVGRAGAKYIHVRSDSRSTSDNPHLGGLYTNAMDVSEDSPQAYLSFSRRFGKVVLQPGVRYEYTRRHISSSMTGSGQTEVTQHYSNLFPWLTVKYYPGGPLYLTARYQRNITHPNFAMINSGLVYNDAYSYSHGNPDLRASVTDRISLSANYRDVTLELRYFHTANPIATIENPVSPGSNIISEYAINFPASDLWSVVLSYYKSFGPVSLYASGLLNFPHGETIFAGERIVRDRMSLILQGNLTYDICDWLSLYSSYMLQGHNVDMDREQRSVQNWNIGINGSFLSDRLSITLEASDILHKANYNNITYTYGNVVRGTYGTNDMRGITLTLGYTLFDKDINISTSRENDDILNRLTQ